MTATPARQPALKPIASAVAFALLAWHAGGGSRALAAPTGGTVTAGSATLQQPNAQTLVVEQSSARTALDWKSFSIGAGESVVFRQPSASAVALNRVVGAEPSAIFGSLQANGQVFLVNPNGVLFGRGASVDVGGLVASTLGISNQDFMAGRYFFTGGAGTGSVVNHATIRAADGGYVALIGNQVANSGAIVANRGSVALAAGNAMLLDFGGDGLLNIKVNADAAAARVDHSGLIQADGGRVVMSVRAKNALMETALNVDGVVKARGLAERDGAIWLDGGRSGVTSVSGVLDASSAGAGRKGGDIRVLGEYVGLFGNAVLDASGPAGGGTVLVGGDFRGANPGIPNALRTFVAPGVSIRADALAAGDGGKVAVWSDDKTQYYGNISARGGPLGGNGGFVEVSGKQGLRFAGPVDTRAPKGAAGTLLLDPANITISGAADDDIVEAAGVFTDKGDLLDPSVLSVSRLLTTLDSSNVVVSTLAGAGLAEAGIITLAAPIVYDLGSARRLTFQAAHDIALNASITPGSAGSRRLSLELNANSTVGGAIPGGTGRVAMGAGVTLDSNGGSISLSGATGTANSLRGTILSGGGAVTIGAPSQPTLLTGALTVDASGGAGGITFSGPVTGAFGLTTNAGGGTTRFAGAVGSGGALASVTVTGATAIDGGAVTTTGAQAYSGAVMLGAGTTLASTGGSSITLSGPVNGAFGLTVNTTGTTTFDGAVGGSTALASLTTNAGGGTVINGGTIVTTGNQTYNDAVTIGAATTLDAGAGTLVFGSTLAGGTHALTLTAGDISFNGVAGSVSGTGALTLQPSAAGTAIGIAGGAGLFSLSAADIGSLANGFSQITIGRADGTGTTSVNAVTFNDPVQIRQPGAAGAIRVDGPVTGAGNASVTLTAGSGGIALNNGITTAGNAITLDGAVTLGANVTLDATNAGGGGGAIGFGSSIDADNLFNLRTLTLNAGSAGAIGVTGAIGGAQPLIGLTIARSNGATFSGPVTAGTITLADTTAGQTISFANGLTANALATIAAGYNVSLAGPHVTVFGNTAFLNTGSVTLGSTAAHVLVFNGGLSTSGNASNPSLTNVGGTVRTPGAQIALGAVRLVGNAMLDATNGGAAPGASILLNGAINADNNTAADRTLTLDAGSGMVLFNGSVGTGANGALAGLDVTGRPRLNAPAINVNDPDSPQRTVRFNGPVQLGGAAVTINTAKPGGTGNNVNFTGTIDALNDTVSDAVMNVSAGTGTVTFGGNVGMALNGRLAELNVTAGRINVNAPLFNLSDGVPGQSSTFNGPVVLGTNALLFGGNNGLAFGSTIDADAAANNRTLFVFSGSGTATFAGSVGNAQALADFDATAAALVFNAAAPQTLKAGAGAGGNTLTLSGPITLGQNLTIDTAGAGNHVVFASTIEADAAANARTLAVNAGAGTVTFPTNIGAARALGGLSVNAGTIVFNAAAPQTIDASGGPGGGSVALTGPVTLNQNLTINAGPNSIAFTGPVDGAFGLTANSSATTTFGGTVGGTTPLASLRTDAAGTTAISAAAIRTSGTQTYSDAVTLGAHTTLTSTGLGASGDILLARAVDGAFSLTVNTAGSTTFGGALGLATPLASLTTDAPGVTAINGGAVKTAGAQTYSGPVTLGANTTLTGTVSAFGSTVTGNGFDLALDFSGATLVGPSLTGIRNLSTGNGGTTELGGMIATTGTQTYGDAVTLSSDAMLTSSGAGAAGDITLAATVQSATPRTLTVNTAGTTRFGAAVGGAANPLLAIVTDAPGTTAIDGGAVTTTAAQTYNDAVTLGANATLTSTGAGAITFASTVTSSGVARSLTVNTAGATLFGGSVGAGNPLLSLVTDAPGVTTIAGGAVTTTGAQTFNDAALLGSAATTLTSTGGGAIAFGGTLDGASGLAINTAGAMVFGGPVGGITALASLATSAGGTTAIDGGGITTGGAQTYGNAVTLGAAATTLTSTGGGAIVFSGALDGASALAVNTSGATTFSAAVGNAAPLLSLATNAGGATAIGGGVVRTTGGQAYDDAVTLGAPATLLTSAANGPLTFASTLNGASALTLGTSGLTTFGGAVGTVTPLTSLAPGAGGAIAVNGGAVVTSGAQSYAALTLGADALLTSTGGGPFVFGSTVQSPVAPRSLTLVTSGPTTFAAAVGGGGNPLLALTTDARSATAINGGAVTTTGSQTYAGAVTLGGNTVLTSTAGGAIEFGAGVNGAFALTGNTAGPTRFSGATALATLTTDAGGTTEVSTSAVTTSGNQTFNDDLVIRANAVLTSTAGSIVFGGNVNADALAANRTLVVNAPAGAIVFSRNVGNTAPLADLDLNAGPAMILFNGAGAQSIDVAAQGGNTVSFNAPVVLGQNVAIVTGGNNLTFAAAIDADAAANNRMLSVVAGTSTFATGIGMTQPLGGLSVAGAAASFGGDIRVTGGGAVDFSNLGALTFTAGSTIATDSAGGTTPAGAVLFGAITKAEAATPAAAWTIDASADGGATAGAVTLGTIGGVTPLEKLEVKADALSVAGMVSARQIFLTANSVATPGGQLVASQPYSNTNPKNAALTLEGLTTPGLFGTVDRPVAIEAPGLFVATPNTANTLPFVFLGGNPARKPVYEFAGNANRRLVFYNGVAPDSPESRSALSAALTPLQEVMQEVLMSGFSKENIRRQLLRGVVLEAGLARPAIDEFRGEGAATPQSCVPALGAGNVVMCR